MQFYPKRTVREQTQRLPYEYRESYQNSQLDRIEIDGCEIHGYFEYSFMEEKSYHEQPTRSQDGSIIELDNYTTFLTPRLIIKYNMMGIEDYRTLMTFLKSKNTFNVTCYDIVADRRVTHEMYFANPQMPIIYQRYLSALGIKDYTIELIGTNFRKNDEQYPLYLDGQTFAIYEDDTWMSFVLRRETEYSIEYSPLIKKFIVTKDKGVTGVVISTGLSDEPFVGVYDSILTGISYNSVEVSPR
jgi:hypothetical protein